MDYRRQPNRPAEMTKPSSTFPTSQEQKAVPSSDGVTTAESEERSPPYASSVMRFLERIGISDPEVENYSSKDFYSNFFGGLHGGVVAAIAERVAVATARTLVGEDKDIFLGELALSYLSSATINAELIVDGSVIRSGRNITLIAIEFKMRTTGELVYSCRATFYNSPIAKL
ncbi:hypothetical protein V6N13_071088 [Hibiscus sabdariffa]